MSQYNLGDFYPRSGQEIKSDGTVANSADSVDAQGNQGVIINGDKVVGPTLIDTIPFSAFTASSTIYKTYNSVLNRGAKKRTFIITSTLNQLLNSCAFIIYESTARQGTTALSGDSYTTGTISVNMSLLYASDAHGTFGVIGDSLQLGFNVPATAPTSGNLYVYVSEVF